MRCKVKSKMMSKEMKGNSIANSRAAMQPAPGGMVKMNMKPKSKMTKKKK